MMHLRNRFLAGALAVMMAVSSMQFPVRNVRAEEAVETEETETGVEGTGNKEEDFDSSAGMGESVEKGTETTIESIETVETTEISEVGTVVDHTESVETTTESIETVETTEIEETVIESTEETGTWETELESEEQKETLVTEESTLESEEETETEQVLKVSEDDIASGTSGNITWVIDVNGNLTVEGTGDFSDSKIPWNGYTDKIITAKVDVVGMTDASDMFRWCSNLASLDLSGFETGSVTDMSYMFSRCSSLTSLDLSGFDTSNVTDMNSMFSECNNLNSLELSGFETSSVTDMNGMFSKCRSLNSLDLSSFETSSVTDMNGMFSYCNSLNSLDLSGFETNNVTDMNGMFSYCNSLTSLELSGFETGSVTDMNGMFKECNNLTSLDLSGFDTSNVISMGGMFSICKSLINLNLSSFNTSNVTDMKEMFSGCNSLTNLDLSVFDTSNVTSMSEMFRSCNSLTNLDLSVFDTSNVMSMSYMFSGCNSLTNLNLSVFDTSNVMSMSYMFSGCNSLTNLNLSVFDTSNVTSLSYMFSFCSSLTNLDLSVFDTSNVRSMKYMFSNCSSLTDLDLSVFNTEKVSSISYIFQECSSLARLDLSHFTIKSTTEVNSMFEGCRSLKEIVNPIGVDIDIVLPYAGDTCSWRRNDGTKVPDNKLLRNLQAVETISTDKKFGISFQGENFTLAGEKYQDKVFQEEIPEEVEVFDKGANTPWAFTIVPDKGYVVKSVYTRSLYGSKIKLTKGKLSDQYIVTPLNEAEGYARDELIEVEIVPETEYELLLRIDDPYYTAGVVVIDEDTIIEKNSDFSIKVSNQHDITICIKAINRQIDAVAIPMLRVHEGNIGKSIASEQNIDTMSNEEKEYFQKGYSIFRIRLFKDTEASCDVDTGYKIKFVEEGFPGEVHVYEYNFKSDENQQREEYTGKEILVHAYKNSYGKEFFVQIKWTDTPEGHNKWCKPQISFKEGNFVRVQEPMEAAGGDVWRVYPQRNMEILSELMPHKIELVDFNENNIIDLQIVDNPHARYDIVEEEVRDKYDDVVGTVTKRYLSVYGGDSLTLSVKLDNGLDTLPAWANNPNLSTAKNADGTYTISVKDMSKILELTTINFGTYDPQNRILLSDLNMNIPLGNPVYTGEPIKPQMPKNIEAIYSAGGKWQTITLYEKTDYTWTCENNVNPGEAFLVITAVPFSEKYRGEIKIPFTIIKAKAPDNQEKTEYIESVEGQTVYQVSLSEKFAIDHLNEKNVVPLAYDIQSYDKGDVLAEDSMPTVEGDKLTYTLRSGADKNSMPARIFFKASYKNYNDSYLMLTIRIVKRETIVLGGTVIVPDKIYDGIESVPDLSALKVISKEGIPVGEAEAVELLGKIYDTMEYHYVGVGDTKYDSERPPIDIGTYKVQAKVADGNIDYKSDYLEGGTFSISQRNVTLRADDLVLHIKDTIPKEYTYSTDNLAEGDRIKASAFVTCDDLNTTEIEGEYFIIVNTAEVRITNHVNKDVTSNYIISGKNGKLIVRQPEAGTFTVTYKGINPHNLKEVIIRSGFESGNLLEALNPPSAEGMIFLGWYKDEALTMPWKFDSDIVQGNITLYAGWMKTTQQETGMVLCVQEILPQTYTGKAIKPSVIVFSGQKEGSKRLQVNKDYKVEYKNNMNADTKTFPDSEIPKGGIGENVNDTDHGFDKRLPYVIITGKGSYTGKVFVNFHIRAADISEIEKSDSGFVLKYADQLDARDSKYAAVVTQFKYKNKTLKCHIDYELAAQKQNSAALFNNKGQILLKAGDYALTITGRGNFTGEIKKQLYIADKSKLMKNAKITCQRTVSNLAQQELIDGVQPRDLVVKLGDGILVKDTDYTVECINNHGIGTATVIVSAKQQSGYIGSKSVTFNIKGTAFKEKVLQPLNLPDKAYTGRAVTLDFRGEKPDLTLTTIEGRNLEYGKDYIVSYKNNIKKGKAAITLKALPASGYSGSFSKKFNIVPKNLETAVANGDITVVNAEKTDSGWYLCETQPYRKAGVTPSDAVSLVLNANNSVLVAGKDYTVSYTNNKKVGTGASMNLIGIGNYEGNINISFDISTASISQLYNEGLIMVTNTPVKAVIQKRRVKIDDGDPAEGIPPEYDYELLNPKAEFRPKVTIKDGKVALEEGVEKDYTLEYSQNTQQDLYDGCTAYVIITGRNNYQGDSITVPISVYTDTITTKKLRVDYETIYNYTGERIMPEISVSYIVRRAKGNPDSDNYEEEETIELSRGTDYRIEYGKNTAVGKGSIKIIGIGRYSGAVTKTFKITPKSVYNKEQ